MERIKKNLSYTNYIFWSVMVILLILLAIQNNTMNNTIEQLAIDVQQSNHLTDLSGKRRVKDLNDANKRIQKLEDALIICVNPSAVLDTRQKKIGVANDQHNK